MGRRGPAPKPTKILELSGSPNARLRPPEPVFEFGIPDPPSELTSEARIEWNRVASMLHKAGVLTLDNRAALAIYCQSWADARMLRRAIGREGWTVPTRDGKKKNPKAVLLHEAQMRVLRFAQEFGLTPSARSRIPVLKEEARDPLKDFIQRKQRKRS
jgi:P27 family predicted phage terminase small subunit